METQEHSNQEQRAGEPHEGQVKKRTRGKGKRPVMFNTSMRLPMEVVEFFDTHYPYSKQAKMREVLLAFVKSQTEGANHGKETSSN